jgi:hypothetical protein
MPWSTLGEAGHGQPAPPNKPVFGESFDGILTARRNEAARRRSQRRHHMPVQLNQKDHSSRGGPARGVDARRHTPRPRHRPVPAEPNARRRPRRSCCSSRADDTFRLLGNARITTRSHCRRSPSMVRATCLSRRATRWRSTAEPTGLAMIRPTRGALPSSQSSPRRTCTTRSGWTIRVPYLTVALKSVDRLMRLRAGSTARRPDVAIRQIIRGGPCGAGWTRSPDRHGCASAIGSRARGLGAGCSAGTSACPWPRRSPCCVSL